MADTTTAYTDRATRAWNTARDCLSDAELVDVRDRALDALGEADRAAVEHKARRLAKATRNLGMASALELLAVVGSLLAEHPEWEAAQ